MTDHEAGASRRLLLLAQPDSYRIAPYIAAARNMNLRVLIASRGRYSLTTEVSQGLHIDLDDLDAALAAILAEAQVQPFAGVIGSDDSTVELAARAARDLGLPHNPPQSARYSRRKDLSRATLALAGCAVPQHCLIDLRRPLARQSACLPWPCVLKPLNMSGSRGVIRVDDEAGFSAACERIRPIVAESSGEFERNHLLVEQYIDGDEVALEAYLHEGKLHALALFDKPDPLTGPYFEETIYVTPSRLLRSKQQSILNSVSRACAALGLVTGPVHAELRVNVHNAWIIEVASRTIGGDCARLLDNGSTRSLEELTLALATGQAVDPGIPQDSRGVMMIPIRKAGLLRRVEGLPAARKVPFVENIEIAIPEGHELVPLPEGNQYLGFIFARAHSPERAVRALKEAYSLLDFVTAPVFRIAAP